MRDLAFIAILFVMSAYALARPHLGVLLWAWTAFLIPPHYMFGFAHAVPTNMIAAIVTLIAWVISREPMRIRFNASVVWLIAFAALATLSTFLTIGDQAAAWREWKILIKVICFSLVVVALINTQHRFQALAWAIVLSLGFHGAMEGLKFVATAGAHRAVGPGSSSVGDNNHFALAMLCTIPLVLFLYQQMASFAMRLGAVLACATLAFAVVATHSRGGLIGISAMAVWGLLRSRQKMRYALFVIPLGAAIYGFAPERWFDRMGTITEAEQDASFMSRVIAWKQSTVLALDHPVLGGGFHALQTLPVWVEYARTHFYLLDFIPTDPPELDAGRAAHSIYFQVLADLGFVGLGIFLGLLGVAWQNSRQVIKKARGEDSLRWAAQLAGCLQYSLVAYMVAGAALSMAYFELIFVIFAMLASLRIVVEEGLQSAATQRRQALHRRH